MFIVDRDAAKDPATARAKAIALERAAHLRAAIKINDYVGFKRLIMKDLTLTLAQHPAPFTLLPVSCYSCP